MSVASFDGILWAGFLLVAAAAVAAPGVMLCRYYLASRRRAVAQAVLAEDRYHDMAAALGQCSAAVDAVITEVSAHPATYATFPPEVWGMLSAAHEAAEAATAARRKGNRR